MVLSGLVVSFTLVFGWFFPDEFGKFNLSENEVLTNNAPFEEWGLVSPIMPADTPPPLSGTTTLEDNPFPGTLPANINTEYELDEDGKGYYIHERAGKFDIRPPSHISMEDYLEYKRKQSMKEFWKSKSGNESGSQNTGLSFQLMKENSAFFKDVFGEGGVKIIPNGMATISLGGEINTTKNPFIPVRDQTRGNLLFDQQIQLNATGTIGNRLKLNLRLDPNNSFGFQNNIKLEYKGEEDFILQGVEAGNVGFNSGNTLIQGSQSVFGIKTKLKMGPVLLTAVASQQKGKTQSISVKNGAQVTEFSIKGHEYDIDRHFFLSHYFRSRYEYALEGLPNINSNIKITQIEVWVTNNQGSSTSQNRNAAGFVDLGEIEIEPDNRFPDQKGRIFNDALIASLGAGNTAYPSNNANGLYNAVNGNSLYGDIRTADSALSATSGLGMTNGRDYVLTENMRKLSPTEFTLDERLGYITLRTQLQPNAVLCVAYQYQVGSAIYKVGDFSFDPGKQSNDLNSNLLFLKMIRPPQALPQVDGETYPAWDLMMKNVYRIGGYGITRDNFVLNINYQSTTENGTLSYLPTSKVKEIPLLQVFNLDQLSNNNASMPDGYFDFLENQTIIPDGGFIVFPVLEPFGSHLIEVLDDQEEIQKYAFPELYNRTQQDAIQDFIQKDRFVIEGSYQGKTGSEIALNTLNVVEGSVVVTANGMQLTEGTDYQVNYQLGRVTILNQALLTSGQEIKVDFESNNLFGIETKSLLGLRADIDAGKDFTLGATFMRLNERPMTNKTVLGQEPVNNMIFGVDGSIRKDSRYLTRLLDKLPLLQTKEVSNIAAEFQGAYLLPGIARALKVDDETEQAGISFLEDFESVQTGGLNLSSSPYAWSLASFPGSNGNNNIIEPPQGYNASLSRGFSRAKLAWYKMDLTFQQNPGSIPNEEEVPDKDLDNHYIRLVNVGEIFPYRTTIVGNNNLNDLINLHFIPDQKGPYNYQVDPAFTDRDGRLTNPEESWAGIQRQTKANTDFEAQNYEFVEFWLMDPFAEQIEGELPPLNTTGGELYLNLGQVSEDVVADGRRNYENGLPESPDPDAVDTTSWGIAPVVTTPVVGFSNDPDAREFQDVGLDGLRTVDEQVFFQQYLDSLGQLYGRNSPAYQEALADPSNDNFQHFRGDQYKNVSILDRYLNFNGHEGNTPVNATQNGYSIQGSGTPESEDLNKNSTLNTIESYFEYQMDLRPSKMRIGENYIVDQITSTVPLNSGTSGEITWYQFRIPLRAGEAINGIQDFKNIEFVRMYMTGWDEEVVLRMAEFQVVSTTWRTYKDYLGEQIDTTVTDPDPTIFQVGVVNKEENATRQPFNYKSPPGTVRQRELNALAAQQQQLQNEQAISLKVCNLQDGDARAVFRRQLSQLDLRSYKRVKMWVHAENVSGSGQDFQDEELRAFIRLGSDNSENYYEYEVPILLSELGNQDSANIWAVNMDIPLDQLNLAKALRNQAGFPVTGRYQNDSVAFRAEDGQVQGHRIYIAGTPKLSEIKTIMVGVRNEKDGRGPICAEVWFNELRCTDFITDPGWAANASINMKLADWGTIRATGSIKTPGFGGIYQTINNRSRELNKRFDVSGQFQMGKFLPKKWGVQLPLYLRYGEQTIDPQYNPLESDVLLSSYLETVNPVNQDSIRRTLIDRRRSKGISFNGIRKLRTNTNRKALPWDIANFSLSFAHNEEEASNYRIKERFTSQTTGGISYTYTSPFKPIQPFKKAKKKNILTDFTFNPLPKSFSVSLNGDRRYEKNIMRPIENQNSIAPTYLKRFDITRNYSLRWDLTKRLNLNFAANNNSWVDEPFGDVNEPGYNRDSVWQNLFSIGREQSPDSLRDSLGFYLPGKDHLINIGRNTGYNHNWSLNYTLPFREYKLTNFLDGRISYQGTFNWRVAADVNKDLGNDIANGQTLNFNGRIMLDKLYEKIPGVRDLMRESKQPARPQTRPAPSEGEEEKKDKKEEDNFVFAKKALQGLARIFFSVKDVEFNYNRIAGMQIAGYLPQTDNFGLDFNYVPQGDTTPAPFVPPSLAFISGWQGLQTDFNETETMLRQWGDNGWITRSQRFNTPLSQNWTEHFDAKTSITLFKDFTVRLNFTRDKGEVLSEIFRFDSITGDWVVENRFVEGQFSMSYIFINSAFEPTNDDAPSFQELEQNTRREISRRLFAENEFAQQNGLGLTTEGYYNGYNGNSQDVLIPAFLSAYGISNPQKITLNAFPNIPLPNWNVNYGGLSNLPFLRKIFKSVNLSHSYSATYTVGGYNSNILFQQDGNGNSSNLESIGQIDANGDSLQNFASENTITTVSMNEQFKPLGVNVTLENGMTLRMNYSRNRQVTFSMSNLQLTESRRQNFTFGLNWQSRKLDRVIQVFGKDVKLNNALNTRLDITLSSSKTFNRTLDSRLGAIVTGGNLTMSINPSVSYTLNRYLNLQFFAQHSRNRPELSNSYPNSHTEFGIKMQFTLTN